ncbi:PolC-type DNA polymerase III [Lewinella sp. LCG006]|uniref:3'-5' exonuclease n=1 Tax=Lewinella sp. LCG006 TaxID=3231911 RepID=UPI00345F1C10
MSWIKKVLGIKPVYPAKSYWLEYDHFFDHPDPKKHLFRNKRMVVLDTETTGLNPTTDRLLSIGAVAVKDQQIYVGDRFEAFFSNEGLYQAKERESVPVHGILQKHWAQLPDNQKILIDLLAYLKDSIIVGHHIAFDFAMLNNAFMAQLGGPLQNQVLDTAHLAQRLASPFAAYQAAPQEIGQYSLDQLCKVYNIPVEGRHTASGDAMLTALLLVKLLGRLEQRGVKTLKDLLR